MAFLAVVSSVAGAQLRTRDGLAATAERTALSSVALDGAELPNARVDVQVVDPGAEAEATGFEVTGEWTAEGGCLRLAGEVRAEGEADRAADLVVRVRGAELALGTMAGDPLLLPAKLLSKLPIVSLRIGGEDCLALALPPDALAIHEFRSGKGFVELRYRFGFTRDARPELQLRAPFRCVLYRTDPQWHFRSALEGYYRLFPQPFEPFIREAGGWFFAAETQDLPNPQHFHYHEGGPAGWQEDDERGLGTYPYQESSSWTISLPGGELPKSYDEAMARFAELEQQVFAVA
ncbi:MAG: hypothetical protein FJX74_24735, partial [Armatimonadetes bacterium]|nr:hypothetical protein [Armatimonadota bacterium]